MAETESRMNKNNKKKKRVTDILADLLLSCVTRKVYSNVLLSNKNVQEYYSFSSESSDPSSPLLSGGTNK